MTEAERIMMEKLGLEEEDFTTKDKRPKSYAETVESLIRERYTISDELAILRQRDSKPYEFAEYNDYAEECKARARMI